MCVINSLLRHYPHIARMIMTPVEQMHSQRFPNLIFRFEKRFSHQVHYLHK